MNIRYTNLLMIIAFAIANAPAFSNPQPSGSAISILAAPVTISNPGTYRLANDVSGDITIAASNVELNLDNRKITAGTNGVSVTSQSGVLIKNGIISNATSSAITMTNATNVTIEDIEFVNNISGVNVFTSTCVQIEDCTFREHSDSAIRVDTSNTILMQNIKAFDNNVEFEGTFTIVNFNDSDDVCVRNVLISHNNNSAMGGSLTGFNFNDCSACQITQAKVEVNDSLGTTICYNSFASKAIVYNESSAVDNTATDTVIGFQLDQTSVSCILNCVAKANSTNIIFGAGTSRGFLLIDCTSCHVQDNLAVANIGATNIGFEVSGALTTAVLGNKSQQHGSNFIPEADLPVITFDISANTFMPNEPNAYDNLSIVQ